jgi:trehalose 6-phosphate phosphatase
MPIPTPVTPAGEAGLAAILAEPERALLAFDFDGVLAPIVDDPAQARPHPRILPALSRLAPYVGSLAIVTGRPAGIAVAYGGFARAEGLDRLVVLGQYGRERWEAATGAITAPPVHPGVAAARVQLPGLLRDLGAGTAWVEDKGAAVAVHTRRSVDPLRTFEELREPLTELAGRLGLVLEPGRLVLELRPPGADKGSSLRAHVAETGARSLAYTGDDLGDLPAFAAIDALRAEGVPGLKIAAGSAEVTAIADRADLVVDGPAGVADLLESLAYTLAAVAGRPLPSPL